MCTRTLKKVDRFLATVYILFPLSLDCVSCVTLLAAFLALVKTRDMSAPVASGPSAGRYAVLSCTNTMQGYSGQPQAGSAPSDLATAVNTALKAGATLVGGVSVAAASKADSSSGAPFFIMSQAVLYPAGT